MHLHFVTVALVQLSLASSLFATKRKVRACPPTVLGLEMWCSQFQFRINISKYYYGSLLSSTRLVQHAGVSRCQQSLERRESSICSAVAEIRNIGKDGNGGGHLNFFNVVPQYFSSTPEVIHSVPPSTTTQILQLLYIFPSCNIVRTGEIQEPFQLCYGSYCICCTAVYSKKFKILFSFTLICTAVFADILYWYYNIY